MEDLLQVGVITQTHGIRGEVKVFPTTDDVNRFKKLKQVILDTGKEKMTLEELFDKIKDQQFDAGAPELTKHGFNMVIAFPPEDRENQVWIIATKNGFTVQRSVIVAGVSNMIKNGIKAEVLDTLSGGITGMISTFGSPKKACMAHCDDVAAKVKAIVE